MELSSRRSKLTGFQRRTEATGQVRQETENAVECDSEAAYEVRAMPGLAPSSPAAAPEEGVVLDRQICASCGDSHTGNVARCHGCPRVICIGPTDTESGCLIASELPKGGGHEFFCPACCRPRGIPFNYTLRANNTQRMILSRTIRPLAVMCLHGRSDDRPFGNVLEATLRAQYSGVWPDGITVAHQTMTTAQPSKLRKLELGAFFEAHSDQPAGTDLLVCFDTYSDSPTGNLVCISNDKGQIAASVQQLMEHYVSEKMLRLCTGRKGIVLLTCGAAMTNPEAFQGLCDYIQSQGIDFVIGFDAPRVIPSHVTLPLVSAIEDVFLYDKPVLEAVASTFGGSIRALHHTNVIVSERRDKSILSQRFAFGPPTSKPWGLAPPQCPGCRQRGAGNGTRVYPSLKHGEVHRVRFGCEICRIRIDGSIERPDWVRLSGLHHLVHHYVLPFPTPEWPPMKWHQVIARQP